MITSCFDEALMKEAETTAIKEMERTVYGYGKVAIGATATEKSLWTTCTPEWSEHERVGHETAPPPGRLFGPPVAARGGGG